MNFKLGSKGSKVVIHLLVWITLFVINCIIVKNYSVDIKWREAFFTWGFYVFVFYINYLLLIPRLLFKRKFVWYAVVALMVLVASFVSIKFYAGQELQRNIRELRIELDNYDDARKGFEWKENERERIHRQSRREQREIQPDSSLTLTEKEERYGQLKRELDRTRGFARGFKRSGYNPFSRFNMSSVYTLILFYMASIVVAYIEKSGRAEKRRREMEKEKVTAELAYLKQQINPHFLFNTLNSIYSYTIGVSGPASDAIIKLSSILRYMLYETNRDRVPLADEIAVIYDYIDLQRLRITEKTTVDVIINGNANIHQIEPMLLIPIIENAFKFGVDSVEPSFVKISIDVVGTDFTFKVSNRIVNKKSGDSSNSGIGIRNIKRRLDLIYGPEDYTLTVDNNHDIFSVTLHLNLKN